MFENCKEAAEALAEAQGLYNAGEYREALHIYSSLADWLTRTRTQASQPSDELAALADAVRRGLAGYPNCDDEFAWERASQMHHDLFCFRQE